MTQEEELTLLREVYAAVAQLDFGSSRALPFCRESFPILDKAILAYEECRDHPHVVAYGRERGREEFTREEWQKSYESHLAHREDGPAYEYANGDREWYQDGKLHRLDGPAYRIKSTEPSWYIDGEEFSFEEHYQLIQEVKDMPLVLRLVDPRRWVREYK